jgi:hypothetical protein
MPSKSGTGLKLWQAILIGLIPAIITGIVSGLFNLQITTIVQDREDQRQVREFDLQLTYESKQTKVALAFNPSSPTPTIYLTTITSTPKNDLSIQEQAIIDYYDFITHGDYLKAWNILSEGFRRNTLSDDYQSYESYWKSAGKVAIVEMVLQDGYSTFAADVLVRLYWESDRSIRSYLYSLIYDLSTKQWKIDKVAILK